MIWILITLITIYLFIGTVIALVLAHITKKDIENGAKVEPITFKDFMNIVFLWGYYATQ